MMTNTYATFTDPHMAEKAGGALMDFGVKAGHISIVFPEGFVSSYHHEDNSESHQAHRADGHDAEHAAKSGITTTTVGDAAKGSVKGAEVGLAAGALAALAAVFIPGVGLVLGGGALAIALGGVAGSTVAGAVAGGVTGYLKDQGVPADATEAYVSVLGSGGAVVTVTPTDEIIDGPAVEGILIKYGGIVTRHPVGSPVMIVEHEIPSRDVVEIV